ncbi:AAA family ATPase [Homoserinibacter sp. YIM 151385]|uniref:AAA family ATPase n=1 Tax=Homoserinibacter sp. YIM 151385 TaxID=2985506 RepID=UPI0022F089F2|nr:AAA family ATPase [Homoserinibacter sp. YIM 151385]WBU39303.1 AAA family ATPase [Homoserinibacter sp. YIM 151385]
MASVAILVTGLPGSGKSTLAQQLAAALDCPALVKDELKEAFAAMLGPHADGGRLGGIALDTLWRLAAETGGGVVVDGAFDARRGDLEHLERGLAAAGAPRVIELWCEVPTALARDRVEARQAARHPVHGRWREAWEGLEPLGAWPLLRVDTSAPVDLEALLGELGGLLL